MRVGKFFRPLGALIGILLIWIAYSSLRHELMQIDLQRISVKASEIPPTAIALSIGLTVLFYSVTLLYDHLAFHQLGISRISKAKITFTSLVSQIFGCSIGLSNLAGSSVRLRLYSRFGVSIRDIGRIVVFQITSHWVGFLALAGMAALAVPSYRLMAPLALVPAIALVLRKSKTWSPRIALSIFERLGASVALYVLMKPATGIEFGEFLGIFLFGQVVGSLSQLPGGLGAFESAFVGKFQERCRIYFQAA